MLLLISPIVIYGQEGSGKFCIDAEPLCGSSFFSYANTSGFNLAENGPDYGCLILSRNPAWFYFQIDHPGDIQLKIEQSTTAEGIPDLDVDFIVYGPFNDPRSPCRLDLTRENVADCSYRIDFVEYLDLTNTLSGEYYLLLITNFSLKPGFITVTQTAGAATTNCILVEAPIVSIHEACQGEVFSLQATTMGAASYNWYEADGTGNFVPVLNNHSETLDVNLPNRYKAEALNRANVVIEHYEFNLTFEDNSPLQLGAEVITDVFIEENDIEVLIINNESEGYEYSMDGGAWQDESIFKNVSLGYHEISVINSSGCRTGTTQITVIDYPQYFTPNNDGYNDYWNIPGLNNQLNAKILIYDRYGKLIKQLSPTALGWDGTFNGNKMPSSDYWFTITYIEPQDGTLKEFKSHFALKR